MISEVPAESLNFSKNYVDWEKELSFTGSLGKQFIKRKRLLKDLIDNGIDINIIVTIFWKTVH